MLTKLSTLLALGIVIAMAVLFMPAKTVLLATLGVAVAVLIFLRTEIGFLLTVAALPFDMLGALTPTGPAAAFTTVSVIKILGVLTFLSWLLRVLNNRQRVTSAPQISILLALIAVGVASIFWGTHFFEKKAIWYLSAYAICIGIIFMTINVVTTTETLHRVTAAVVIAGVVVGLFALAQLWVPTFQKGEIVTVEQDVYGSYGAIVDISEQKSLGRVVRVSGGTAHADYLALFLGFSIALSVYRFEVAPSALFRMLWFAALLVQVISLAMTYSRSGTYLVFITVGLMVLRRVVTLSWPKVFLCLTALGIVILVLATSPTALDRMLSPSHLLESDSIRARVELIAAGWRMFTSAGWLTGVGLGNFDVNVANFSQIIAYAYPPCNEYLRILTETGLVGLVLSLVLFGWTFRDFRAARRRLREAGETSLYKLATTLETILIGLLLFGIPHVILGRKEWPLVIALGIVINRLSLSLPSPEKPAMAESIR